MSRLFNSHKEERQIYTDEELEQLSGNDGYYRRKLFLDILVWVVCILVVLLGIAMIYEYITDVSFRNFIITQVENSFTGIVFAVLTILGIKLTQR